MTADDVRARFEAWLLRLGYTSRPERRPSGKYVNGQIQGNWLAWQAAHADLVGEVRKLVEALDVARGKVNHVHLSLANNRVVGGSFSVDDETSCRWTGSLNIAGARLDDIRRALAKHTHQETK